MKWIRMFEKPPERVFVVHGEEEICIDFALRLIEEGFKAEAPKYASIYDLLTGETVFAGRDPERRSEPGYQKRESPVYKRLLQSGTRLLEVITRNRGGANKDIAKFADQVDALVKKWDR